ncbi:hypothetical protein ACFRFL_33180 [Streptomyces sp. NPDC056708]|uniref:hypothetical protein n=1 Tax=unclassified Streptomyces TaxID=2593676 RepID=UPI0036C6DCF6
MIFGTALHHTTAGLLGVALDAIVRSSAGTIAASVGIHLVLPGPAALLPTDWAQLTAPYAAATTARPAPQHRKDPSHAHGIREAPHDQ